MNDWRIIGSLPMRSHEPVIDEPVAIYTADELVSACVYSGVFGVLLTVGAAFAWSFL
jgi:hypothetical protein